MSGGTNQPPVCSGGIADVYHWVLTNPNLPVEIGVGSFYDDYDLPADLIYSVSYNSAPSIVGASVNNATDTVILTFSGTSGLAEITVRATDSGGLFAETGFTAYNVAITGVTVEEKGWDQVWAAPADGDVLFLFDYYRWKPVVDPVPAADKMDAVDWWRRPYDQSGGWVNFALTQPPNGADWAYGEPPTGDWFIKPVVWFPGQVRAEYPISARKIMTQITGVWWQEVDPTPSDGVSNFQEYPAASGQYIIFPERNRPAGTPGVDAVTGNPVDQIHNQVDVYVSLWPPLPAGYAATVNLRVFDPDNDLPGGIGEFQGDPNDTSLVTYNPDDNYGSPGMTLTDSLAGFEPGQVLESERATINPLNAGNNFIVAANHDQNSLDALYFWPADGKTLVYNVPSQGSGGSGGSGGMAYWIVPSCNKTPLLTAWRRLWVELDSMVAPPAPFDPAEDDAFIDPGTLPIDMARELLLPAKVSAVQWPYDTADDLPFVHYLAQDIANPVTYAQPYRDALMTVDFWAAHVIGSYESSTANDHDPNGQTALKGSWYLTGAGGPGFVFIETIRDWVDFNYPSRPDIMQESFRRVTAHETLHGFFGAHGTPEADEGIMNTAVGDNFSQPIPPLTQRQLRVVQQNGFSR